MHISIRNKPYLVHLSCTPAALSIRRIKTIPSDKQNIHLAWGSKSSIGLLLHHELVDPDDSCMPVLECRVVISPIFMRQDHHVWLMGLGGLFYPTCILSHSWVWTEWSCICIIDPDQWWYCCDLDQWIGIHPHCKGFLWCVPTNDWQGGFGSPYWNLD